MNVNDIEDFKTLDRKEDLEAIFERQRELAEKYHDIEVQQGVGRGLLKGKFDINDIYSQEVCKNFAWRVTEEITEATSANEGSHQKEEAADALHFLVELLIIVGVPVKECKSFYNLGFLQLQAAAAPYSTAYRLIEELGLAMNCLKQKPWKQTHVLTDSEMFKTHLRSCVFLWARFAKSIGMSREEAFDFYFKKSEVNEFRIRSKY